MSFWGELKRRNVVKVGAGYLILAWLLAQVASVFAPALNLPGWAMSFVAFVLILGFPLALFLAWAYELTPDGIKQTNQVPPVESIAHLTGHKLNYVVTGLLVLAVGFMALDAYVLTPAAQRTLAEDASAASGEPAETDVAPSADDRLPNSVAVLPFDNLSLDPDDAYFAVGLHDEILNQLAKLRSLNVISRTSVLRYSEQRPPIPAIAEELNVETVMEGSVRYAGNRILVTVQLIDGQSDAHIWSESYPGDLSDLETIFALQADIASNVASALQAELSPEERQRLARLPTVSTEAYELYLAARTANSTTGGLTRALGLIDRALEIDPSFAVGWALKSVIQSTLPLAFPDRADEEQALGEETARRAISLDPDLSDAHAALGFALSQRLDWVGAERAYRRALAVGSDPADSGAYSLVPLAAGHFERARDILLRSRKTNPGNLTALGALMYANYLGGDWPAADAQYGIGKELGGDWTYGDDAMRHMLVGRNELDRARALSSEDPITRAALANLDAPESALGELRRLFASDAHSDPVSQMQVAVWAAHFGDTSLALEALRASKRRSGLNTYLIWLPQFEAVRRLPDFRDLLRDIGIVDYWQEYGWPDICKRTGTGDEFACS
jgi:TolB-like protein/Tfp pilus assembly protein PilF